ncbi:MAG: M1 family metallopeptidase [Bacteroidetes bacterium]|nr:M1 family metallopeptidase [Bacteroidota bacterium]
MKYLLVSLLFYLIIQNSLAQDYFQQQVNYKINVTLDDKNHFLYAWEEIEYVNNSPDDLEFIYFHLWPNAYKNNKTAFAKQKISGSIMASTKFHYAREDDRGYIDSLDFKVNGQKVPWEYDPEHIDICKLYLNKPLKSGERITITTPFSVKLPHTFSRLGHVKQSYQISQWYPKPAVYDRYGWHPMPYLDQGEFYSEYGSFDVSITLPKNYVVGATGVLMNKEEIEWLGKKSAVGSRQLANSVDTIMNDLRIEKPAKNGDFPPSDTETKTLRYVQDNIHDFAWFADKRYNVLKSEVVLPHSKRKVTTWLMFTNRDAETWKNSVKNINDAVYYYSLWNGDYPYNWCTAVEGALGAGGGMEYPMVTVTGTYAIIHEVGHNWFYGILGSNERDHAWMDEGINTYFENRISRIREDEKKSSPPDSVGGGHARPGGQAGDSTALKNRVSVSKKKIKISFSGKMIRRFGMDKIQNEAAYKIPYTFLASRGLDQPIQLESDEYIEVNYGVIVYFKTAVAFHYLEQYLGKEKFDKAMQTYFDKWKFKHPYPEDLQKVFEDVTGENMNWFFDQLINTSNKIDIAVARIVEPQGNPDEIRVNTENPANNSKINVVLKNRGKIVAPVPVSTLSKEGVVIETKWTKPITDTVHIWFEADNVHRIMIDAQNIVLEVNQKNNVSRVKGIAKKTEPFELQFLFGLDDPKKTQLYYFPAIGYNTTDEFMLGLGFYNSALIKKRLSFVIMPMYSVGLNILAGSAMINYSFYPSKLFDKITLTGTANVFSGYKKIEPSVKFNIKPKSVRYGAKQDIRLAYTTIFTDQKIYPDTLVTFYEKRSGIISANYNYSRGDAIKSLNISLGLISKPGNFIQPETEINFSYQFIKKNFINIRSYLGGFISKPDSLVPTYRLNMYGSTDNLMNEIYIDRAQKSEFATGFVRQTDNQQGAFKSYVPVDTDKWIASLNLQADIPKTPFAVFTDFGMVADNQNFL